MVAVQRQFIEGHNHEALLSIKFCIEWCKKCYQVMYPGAKMRLGPEMEPSSG